MRRLRANYPGGPQSALLFISTLARAKCRSFCWLTIASLIFTSFYLAANLWTVIFIWYVYTKSAIYGVAQRFSRESWYQRGRMNTPFRSASADRQHVCFVYRRKGKDFDVQLCFSWRGNASHQSLKDKNQNRCWSTIACIYYPVDHVESFQLCRIHFTYSSERRGGWLGKHFPSHSVGPVNFSWLQVESVSGTWLQEWTELTSLHKSGVAMYRSISLNTCQSWQGSKVKNIFCTQKSPQSSSVFSLMLKRH